MTIPTNPILVQDGTGAPRFAAGRDGIISVPSDEGLVPNVVTSGEIIDASAPIAEGGIDVGELLTQAAANGYPLNLSTPTAGPLTFEDSAILGPAIAVTDPTLESSLTGRGTTPIQGAPGGYAFSGPVIATDPNAPVRILPSSAFATIPNDPVTESTLVSGQNAPMSGGPTSRNLGVVLVVTPPGTGPAIL